MQRRDMIYRLTESTGAPAGDQISVTLEGVPDYLPAYPGIVRMTAVTGRWTFRQARDRTAIDLVMHIEPGGNVPLWLANRRIVGTPTKMIENLQREFAAACGTP